MAKLTPRQWHLIKAGSRTIQLRQYQQTLRLLQDMETKVLGKSYQSKKVSQSKISLQQAKKNTLHLLSYAKKPHQQSIITMIKAQKHKERFNIYLNHHYAFPVSEDVLVKYHLHEGMPINETERQQLVNADNFSKIYSAALTYLSRQLRTKHEILLKLQQRYPHANLMALQRVIKILKKYHFINDQHYAAAYVRDSIQNKRGPNRIKQHLYRKGINSELTSQVINNNYPKQKQIEVVTHLAKRRYQFKKRYPFEKRIEKTKQYLVQRGFDFDTINAVVEQCHFQPDLQMQKNQLQRETIRAFHKYERYHGYERILKIKQYLVRRGFSFDDANDAVSKYY